MWRLGYGHSTNDFPTPKGVHAHDPLPLNLDKHLDHPCQDHYPCLLTVEDAHLRMKCQSIPTRKNEKIRKNVGIS